MVEEVRTKTDEIKAAKRTASQAGLGEMDQQGEELLNIILQSNINLSSIDRISEALKRRRIELESTNDQKKNMLLCEFLERMIEKREKAIKQLHNELDLLKTDRQKVIEVLRGQIGFSSQRIVPEFASTGTLNVEPEEMQSSQRITDSLATSVSGTTSPSPLLPEDIAKYRRRLQRHFGSLESTYFSYRIHPFSGNDEDSDRFSIGSCADELEEFSQVLNGMSQYGDIKRLATLNYNIETTPALSIVSSIEFDKDGEYFVIAGVTKKIKVYDYNAVIEHNSETHYPLTQLQCSSKISNVSWNPYIKNLLASSDYDGIVQLWDTNVGKPKETFREHEKRCWTVQFNNVDPHLMASGSDDAKVKLWSVNCPSSVGTIDAKVNVCCVYFSPTSRNHLVFGSADHCVHLYDIRYKAKPVNVFRGHRKAVSYVKYCNEHEVVSASTDSNLRVWDVTSGKCLRIMRGHQNEKNFVGLATDGNHIVCGSENNQLYLYYKAISEPIMAYDFNSRAVDNFNYPDSNEPHLSLGMSSDSVNNNDFVSAVCWKKNTNVVVAANSQGTTHILQLI
uniref:Uncharacterized protein n=1 Tax=Acrobeloides nanus TaxID=290746 RepID=A0A914CF55_9BILA